MIKRNVSKAQQKAAGKSSAMRWATYSIVVTCSLMLASGFFFAARQHFSSMDYGMKNSRLRKQVDELEAEKRRLILAREVSLSPAEVKKAAKKAGMLEPVTPETDLAQQVAPTKEKAVPTTTAAPASAAKSMVIKTAAVTPAPPAVPATFQKIERPREVKKTLPAE